MKKNRLFALSLILFIVGILNIAVSSYKDLFHKGSMDIRNRIVAARMIAEGHNPYISPKATDLPDRLIDPFANPARPFTRASVTPFNIMLHMPLSRLGIEKIIPIWFVVQLTLLFLSVALLLQIIKSRELKTCFLVICVLFLLRGPLPIHLYFGQIYLLYVFIAAIFINVYLSKNKSFITGGVLALLSLVRPTYLLVLCVRMVKLVKNFYIGFVVILFVLLSSSFLIVKPEYWITFKDYVLFIGDNLTSVRATHVAAQTYPGLVEGIHLHQNVSVDFSASNSSLKGIIEKNTNVHIPSILIISIFCASLLLTLFFSYMNKKKISQREVLLIGILMSITSEFFIPSPRYIYADVQWIVPLAIVLSGKETFPKNKKLILLLICSFVIYMICPVVGTWAIAFSFLTLAYSRFR